MLPVAVILNPYSGRGKGRRIRPLLEAALHNAGLEFELLETKGKGDAIDLAQRAKQQGARVVVAVGGDGTINEVVNGLMRAAHAAEPAGNLAVLPIGTGNDFAYAIGQRAITTLNAASQQQVEKLVQSIRQQKQRLIDVGFGRVQSGNQTSERYFDNCMAAGLEAQAGIYSIRISGLPPRVIYTLAAIQAIFCYQATDVQLRWQNQNGAEETISQQSMMISIGNSNRTGGGFLITPNALLDDGQFDVALIRKQPRPALLALLPRAMVGKHTTHPAVTMLRTSHIVITSKQGIPVHMDGEIISERATQLEIEILPARLAVVD